ncbi:hypothetical protein Btru_016208 [Bulinus truncatus]|nr:hypothetical protein Btru_016208 [Bulinus truncatus]
MYVVLLRSLGIVLLRSLAACFIKLQLKKKVQREYGKEEKSDDIWSPIDSGLDRDRDTELDWVEPMLMMSRIKPWVISSFVFCVSVIFTVLEATERTIFIVTSVNPIGSQKPRLGCLIGSFSDLPNEVEIFLGNESIDVYILKKFDVIDVNLIWVEYSTTLKRYPAFVISGTDQLTVSVVIVYRNDVIRYLVLPVSSWGFKVQANFPVGLILDNAALDKCSYGTHWSAYTTW